MVIKSCLILGDSIAKGIAGVLKGCSVIAKIGMTSGWILTHTPHNPRIHYDTIIVSAGTNDKWQHYKNTEKNIKSIIYRNPDSTYIFIIPNDPVVGRIVESVPGSHINFVAGKDHIHPKSYYAVVKSIRTLNILK